MKQKILLLFLIASFYIFSSGFTHGATLTNKHSKTYKVKHPLNTENIVQNPEDPPTVAMSLDEAILLAVRTNPNVQSSKLNYVSQKFSLWVQEWEFIPHLSFQASAGYNEAGFNGQPVTTSHNYNIAPGVSLLTPYGTNISLSGTNTKTNHYNPGLSLQIQQHLIRGFGRPIVEASLNNARDSAYISRLNIEGVLRNTVSEVINAYLNVVSAELSVKIDEATLKLAQTSVKQTRLFIKAGSKAGNELVTVEANVASAQSALVNEQNNLVQARYALLAAIGIDPNSNINFTSLNLDELISKYHLPPLSLAKILVLENDIQFQTDEITLHGPRQRDLMVAMDNTRWQLDFATTLTTGNGSGGGWNAGVNSLFNYVNQGKNVSLVLNIPIFDQQAKQSVLNAKIALKQAELALTQEKWSKETGAINGWNNVMSAKRALSFAIDAEKLQKKTYQVSYQKYVHGLIDSLVLQSALQSLSQAQQASLNARINYIKSLVNMDLLIGNTLRTWKVNVRLQ